MVNISVPLNRTEMVLYSKFAYGSQFSGEKNILKIRYMVVEILSKNPVSFFLGHPVHTHYTQKKPFIGATSLLKNIVLKVQFLTKPYFTKD